MKTLSTLKPKSKFFGKDFYVFDTETRGLRAKSDAFIFGVLYGHDTCKVIYSVEHFKEEFEQDRYRNKKIFAHNAEYDLNVIYDNIYQMDNRAIFNGKFISATNGNCFFADSMNIYPTSVKKIGDMMKLYKMELSNEYHDAGEIGEIKQKDIEYCIRDCEIVYKALLHIFELVGTVKITIGGLSLSYYRTFYQPYHIDFDQKMVNYFFKSYFGGRTEAFKIGKINNALVFDINSMYPHCMDVGVFPNPRTLKKINAIPLTMFTDKYLKHYEGCAYIKLFHVEHYFGFLPVKHENKLMFPNGHFEGWFNFNEIRFALQHKTIEIKEVKQVVYGERMPSPFKEFVHDNYRKRIENNNDLEKTVFKLLMNNLYGKFAQKIKHENIYIEDMKKQIDEINHFDKKGQILKIRLFNEDRDDCFLEINTGKNNYLYNTIPVFSSYITSEARILLLKYLLKYKLYIPVYCDTDSIFLEKNPKILDSKELGMLKKEDKIVTEVRGLKNYSYLNEEKKEINKIKGVPKTAKKINNTYYYENLLKTREAIVRKLNAGTMIKRKKTLKFAYNKREILSDGQTKAIQL